MSNMSNLVIERKEKRWGVYARAHSITINTGSIHVEDNNISGIVNSSNMQSGVTEFVSYLIPTTVHVGDIICLDYTNYDVREMVKVASVDITTKIITLESPTVSTHSVSGHISFRGGYHSQLNSDIASGSTMIILKDFIGVVPGLNIAVGYGTNNVELVTVTSVSGDMIYINKGLSYDHTQGERVEEYDDSRTTQGSDSRIIYDVVYGRRPNTGGYVAVSDSSRLPWILELETLSFDEAKTKAITLANKVGLENVRVDRIVDLSEVLYPIS